MSKRYLEAYCEILSDMSKTKNYSKEKMREISPKYGDAIYCEMKKEGAFKSLTNGTIIMYTNKFPLLLARKMNELNEKKKVNRTGTFNSIKDLLASSSYLSSVIKSLIPLIRWFYKMYTTLKVTL